MFLSFCFCPQLHRDTSNRNLSTTVFTSTYKRQLYYIMSVFFVCQWSYRMITWMQLRTATPDIFIWALFCGLYTCLHRFLEPYCFFSVCQPCRQKVETIGRKNVKKVSMFTLSLKWFHLMSHIAFEHIQNWMLGSV